MNDPVAAARREVLLAIADDDLVAGHVASTWTGVAPSIEEDLAFSTIAQDELNHADLWYQVVLGPEADRENVDGLGLGREPHEYRHAAFVERAQDDDFGTALARHWLHDHAETLRLRWLAGSGDAEVAAVARRLLHEERYHLEHADLWFRRLAGADDDVTARWRSCLRAELAWAHTLFEPTIGQDVAVEAGLVPAPIASVRDEFAALVGDALTSLGWQDLLSDDLRSGGAGPPAGDPGGRHGVHGRDFAAIWEEMTMLPRAHPGATW